MFLKELWKCKLKIILPTLSKILARVWSCSTALLHIVDDIVRASDLGRYTTVVLLDFSRAFDPINHSLFLKILYYIDFSEHACNLLESFVKNRKQRVRVDDNYSTFLEINNGIPQGSVLGPFIFSIYSGNILKVLRKCFCHLYADDTLFYYSFLTCAADEISTLITNELNNFVRFATELCLVINAKKTNAILFSNLIIM